MDFGGTRVIRLALFERMFRKRIQMSWALFPSRAGLLVDYSEGAGDSACWVGIVAAV